MKRTNDEEKLYLFHATSLNALHPNKLNFGKLQLFNNVYWYAKGFFI